MGSGIALACAQAGFRTLLFDKDTSMLKKAESIIRKNGSRLADKKKITQVEIEQVFDRIHYIDDISQCNAYLIIEAITENVAAKVALFRELAEYNNEEVVFASNTSSLSISAIQEQVPYPERVAGMHFFNPAHIMKLVEIVKGRHTRDSVILALEDICLKLGKKSVVCTDTPGFIVNRVARHYYLESLRLLEAGAASMKQMDDILESTGFIMGPFRLMDLIGLDINLATTESLFAAFGNTPRFAPSSLQVQKVATKELGRKTRKGFYDYEESP